MIWISQTMDLFIPPRDRAGRFADDVMINNVLYRKLTRTMFERLAADRAVRRASPGKFADLVGAIFEQEIENMFYEKCSKQDNPPVS
ncbi:MAG: hypothetical protein LUG50_12480 [Planctomycetaceae bacterium]|nr:hypothetical protein [Planctomycetaceae bacterium]